MVYGRGALKFLFPRQLRLWPRPIAAEPILVASTWIAAWHVMLSDNSQACCAPWWADIGLSHTYATMWAWLMLTTPVYVIVAYALIMHGVGRLKVFGLWLRLGGNVGIMLGVGAFVTARLRYHQFEPPDAAFFALIMLSGVLAFTCSLVVRDILVLIKLDKLACVLERQ